uniref:Uncharacterized protein n=1 Tax=Anguilla anguilla TaxID=7936 RepID=A0A0E9SLL7_ANGAN
MLMVCVCVRVCTCVCVLYDVCTHVFPHLCILMCARRACILLKVHACSPVLH